jgi:hypothetical protein
VLPDRSWKPEAIILLFAGVLLGWSCGILLGAALGPMLPASPERRYLYQFLFTTVSLHAVALVLTHHFLRQHELTWGEFLGWRAPGWRRAWPAVLLASLVMIPGALLLNKGSAWALEQMRLPVVEQPTVRMVQATMGWGQCVAVGVGAIVLAPVVEEILFRGALFAFLRQVGSRQMAYAVSAVAFAAIHTNLVTFVPLVFIGVVLARVYERSGQLLTAMATHALFNAVNFALLLLAKPAG